MNGNKKVLALAFLLLFAVLIGLSACKSNSPADGETVVVTDENGVPVTDENGENVTVVLATTVVEVTNANGEKVYDENGEVKTSVQYIPQDVGVPVTDENGEFVTDENGKVVTTMVTYPPTTNNTASTGVPVTNPDGTPQLDENGETVTEIITYTTDPATPGGNNANWGATFGGSGNDAFVDTAAMPDGGYAALVQSASKDGNMASLAGSSALPIPVLVKYKENGTVAWQTPVHSDGGVIVTGLTADKKGNLTLCGYTRANDLGYTNAGGFDAVVMHFNSRGELLWTRGFGGSETDGFEDIAAAPDGGVVAVGYSASPNGTGASLGLSPQKPASIVVKYTEDGEIAFMRAVGGAGDALVGVAVDAQGNVFAVGGFSSGKLFAGYGRADACVLKFSPDGEQLWAAQYGGSDIDNFTCVAAADDGGCVIAGRTKSNDHDLSRLYNHGGYDAVVVKFDANGAKDWETSFCGLFDDAITDIIATPDGFAAAGYSNSANRDLRPVGNRGGEDAFVITLSARGRILSAQGYGGSGNDRFNGICQTKNGALVACGTTLSGNGDPAGSGVQSDGEFTVGMIARFAEKK